MKIHLLLLFLISCKSLVFAQYIEMDRTSDDNGLTINKTGIGLNVVNDSHGIGTAITGGKAIFQTHDDSPLIFRTNNSANNQIQIYNNEFSIGPLIYSTEIFTISKGRLKFTGSKDLYSASGIEFTNAAGTALRGFVGMADDGGHLGFWGFGNYAWNVRMNANNGYMGIGGINPLTRLHVNGNIKALNLGNTIQESLLLGNSLGNFTDGSITNYAQVSPLDFSYKSGTTDLVNNSINALYFNTQTIGQPLLSAPIIAPNGVTLGSINIGFIDNSLDYNLEVCLYRANIDGSGTSNINCFTTAGFPNSDTPITTIEPITGFSPILDYNSNIYRLQVRCLDNSGVHSPWPGTSLKFIRANISYNYLNY